MTEKRFEPYTDRQPFQSKVESPRAEANLFEELANARRTYRVRLGGFVCLLLAVGVLAIAMSDGWRQLDGSPAAAAEGQVIVSAQLADRTNCTEIGSSDLRSSREGLWFQSNCIPLAVPPFMAKVTTCNRTSLDPAEFTSVAPRLYVTRRTPASQGFLWYASSEACFDLVSAKVVTAVCNDQAVSFSWNANLCSAHGGVLAWVNGR